MNTRTIKEWTPEERLDVVSTLSLMALELDPPLGTEEAYDLHGRIIRICHESAEYLNENKNYIAGTITRLKIG